MVKRDNIYGNRIMILLLILVYFMSTVILITVREIIDNSTLLFILRAIFCGSLIIVFIFIPFAYSKLTYKLLIFAIFLYSCVPTLLQGRFCNYEDLVIIQIIEMLLIYTTFSYIVAYNFLDVLIFSMVQSILFVALLWQYLNLSNCFFFFVYNAFTI